MCNDKRWAETSGLKIEGCILKDRLPFSILLDDGVVPPLRPVRRVVDEVTARLIRNSMITVKTFNHCQYGKAWEIITAKYLEDTVADIHRICYEGSEPLDPLTEWMLYECEVNIAKVESTLQERESSRDRFRQLYAVHWRSQDIDVVMCPITCVLSRRLPRLQLAPASIGATQLFGTGCVSCCCTSSCISCG